MSLIRHKLGLDITGGYGKLAAESAKGENIDLRSEMIQAKIDVALARIAKLESEDEHAPDADG